MNYIDILNFDENKLKELLIDNFVTFFGNKHFDLISQKIKSTDLYYLISPINYNNLINKVVENLESSCTEKILANEQNESLYKKEYIENLKKIKEFLFVAEKNKSYRQKLEEKYTKKFLKECHGEFEENFLRVTIQNDKDKLKYLEEHGLLNSYKKHFNSCLNEFICNDPFFKETIDLISNRTNVSVKGLKNRLYNFIHDEECAFSTCYLGDNGLINEVYISALYFAFNYDLERTLYHEFIHAIGKRLIRQKKHDNLIAVGLDEKWQFYNQRERPFYALNEILTDFVARDMAIEMRKQNKQIYNITIFDTLVTYEFYGKDLLMDFYNTYKEEIKDSLITGDLSYLVNKVGWDNLLKVGEITNKYMKVGYSVEQKYYYYMSPESLQYDEKEELIGEMKKVLKNIKRS